jgi:hypothetical protein
MFDALHYKGEDEIAFEVRTLAVLRMAGEVPREHQRLPLRPARRLRGLWNLSLALCLIHAVSVRLAVATLNCHGCHGRHGLLPRAAGLSRGRDDQLPIGR